MVEVFKYVDKFFTSLTNYLSYNYIFIIFVGLFLFTALCVVFFTSRAYEARLIKAIDKFNVYFIDNPQINDENLVAFNAKMKDKKVPKQLRKNWQQFVLYREDKASTYMSFENCVATPIKNSTYSRDLKTMNILAWIFSLCALALNAYHCYETIDLSDILRKVLLTPIIILLLNYIIQIFLNLRHSAIISDLFQNYQYFEVNIDKATETLPDYVDYEVLFDRNEIKKGIPILYTYLQKRAEEEQRELERARLKNVEHEKFNFDDQGVAAALVLERAMQEAENYIAERKKYTQDIGQINADITQEDMNYREITKEYNRQMQVSKETFANFKSQLEEVSSTIEANYLKKQQQQELDRQRNLERDFDAATERHKKVIESYHAELDTVDKFIAQSRKNLEDAMKSEFSSYASKVYDEVKDVVDEKKKENFDKLKNNIQTLEETLVIKNQELENVYKLNQELNDKLLEIGVLISDESLAKQKRRTRADEIVEEVRDLLAMEQSKDIQKVESVQVQPEVKVSVQEDTDEEPEDKPMEVVPDVKEEPVVEFEEEKFEEEPAEENSNQTSTMSYQEYMASLRQPFGTQNETYKLEEQPEVEEVENNDNKETDLYDVLSSAERFSEEQNANEEDVFDFDSEEDDWFEEDISTEEDDDSMEEVKPATRRGRPRKVEVAETSQTQKKRPGRPRKVVAEQTQAETKKRGRGRPKKVATQQVQTEEKRGRGRPKKIEIEAKKEPVKRPGRPKKVATEVKVVKENKKGRGRPRKVEQTEEKQVKPVKKGRGRPRKQAVEQASKKSVGRPKKVEITQVKKNGRGRPRKEVQDIKNIKDIDEYLKEIDNAIAAENAKIQETQKELAKNSKLKRKK